MVKTAIVLAGGLGTRLRAVVHDVPKPMAPIHGRPFLAHQLDYWITQGIERFILSVGYKHQLIIDYFSDTYHDATIDYVIEPTPLGTGGGLLFALNTFSLTSPCLLLNGDTYFDVDLRQLTQFSLEKKSDWTFSLFYTQDPGRYMGIELNKEGRIQAFQSTISSQKRLANGGVYCFNPASIPAQLKEDMHALKPMSLEQDIFPAILAAQGRLFGFESKGTFIDIGLPEDYFRSARVLSVEALT